jgi:phage terminase small subunit
MSKIKLSDEQKAMAKELTSLQRKVVIGIVGGLTHRKAYVKAGGKAKKAQGQDASVAEILGKPIVRAFLDSLMNKAAENAVITREEAIGILADTAKLKITDVCDFQNVQIGEDDEGTPVFKTVWTMKNSEDIPDHIARSIKSVTATKDGPKIELHDSHGSIKQLSSMMGWDAPKKTELTGAEGKPLEVKSEVKAPEIANALAGLLGKL